MKFVVDAQLPPALARVLRDSGCDAVAVREIGLRDATDSDIWHHAIQQEAAIITKDEDFAQRKVLQPNNCPDLDTLERTLLAFGRHYEQIAQPFEWKFTRKDLHKLLDRLEQPTPQLQLAA